MDIAQGRQLWVRRAPEKGFVQRLVQAPGMVLAQVVFGAGTAVYELQTGRPLGTITAGDDRMWPGISIANGRAVLTGTGKQLDDTGCRLPVVEAFRLEDLNSLWRHEFSTTEGDVLDVVARPDTVEVLTATEVAVGGMWSVPLRGLKMVLGADDGRLLSSVPVSAPTPPRPPRPPLLARPKTGRPLGLVFRAANEYEHTPGFVKAIRGDGKRVWFTEIRGLEVVGTVPGLVLVGTRLIGGPPEYTRSYSMIALDAATGKRAWKANLGSYDRR